MIGNCHGVDTDLFYEPDDWGIAATYCRGCPVLAECRLEFAYDAHAYAGGMTPQQRAAWNHHRMAPLKKKRSGGRGGHAKITDEQVKQVLNMFDSELIGCKAIAEKVGISKSSCQRILTQYGRKRTEEERLILSREGGAKGAGNRTDGNTTRAMIKKLYEERTATGRPMYTPAEIAEMVGVSRSYVYEIHCQQKRGES